MRRQRGFTILELMVTVIILGIVCAIALPALLGTKRTVQSQAEVSQFFTELRVREDQYYAENGVYLSTGATESATFPATPSAQGQSINFAALPATWTQLRVVPPMGEPTCAYVVIAGKKGDPAGAIAAAAPFSFVPPTKNWYYLLAHCNADDDPALDGYFVQTSADATIQSKNNDN